MLLHPAGNLSLAILTILSSVIRSICSFHFFFLTSTQSLMLSIPHVCLMFSLLSLSISVFPAIFRAILISVASNILLVLDVSSQVSAAYVNMGLIAVLQILAFVSVCTCLFHQIALIISTILNNFCIFAFGIYFYYLLARFINTF